MANEPVNPPIQTKYAEQLASDLDANRAEQAAIAARLDQLQAEEKWLSVTLESMQTAVGSESTSPEGAAVPAGSTSAGDSVDEASVPQPRTEKAGDGAAPVKKAAVKKAAARKTAAKKTAATGAEKATASARSAGPTLGELLTGILAQRPGEPLKVSEIRTELEAAHPERATSDQVVRNALGNLVKKDKIEKDNRQGVVLYTWPVGVDTPAAAPESVEGAVEVAPAGV